MPRQIRSLAEMNNSAIAYLAQNTDLTYLSEGSIARALLESSNREIARLQSYIASTYSNVFLNTASGYYLDVIGEMLGRARFGQSPASVSAEDRNIKFSVHVGRLGDHFPIAGDSNLGSIPAGTTISTVDGTIAYTVNRSITFNKNLKEVFVPATAVGDGAGYNVGKFKLVVHSGSSNVNVTNLKVINNGNDVENDTEYRFRLANVFVAAPSANESSIRLAIAGNPSVARVEFKEFARGAGTFDALLVPIANTVTNSSRELVQEIIEQVSAFGINGRAIEPIYVRFKVSVQLIPAVGTGTGAVDSFKINTRNAILDHLETIPLGGELIINRLRGDILNALDSSIKDIRLLELCINGRPHAIRNYQLASDELFTPDVDVDESAIRVI